MKEKRIKVLIKAFCSRSPEFQNFKQLLVEKSKFEKYSEEQQEMLQGILPQNKTSPEISPWVSALASASGLPVGAKDKCSNGSRRSVTSANAYSLGLGGQVTELVRFLAKVIVPRARVGIDVAMGTGGQLVLARSPVLLRKCENFVKTKKDAIKKAVILGPCNTVQIQQISVRFKVSIQQM